MTTEESASMSAVEIDALERYGDIIDLPHPTSRKHARMAQVARAAQFSPFAALTGYHEAIEDTAVAVAQEVDAAQTSSSPFGPESDIAYDA